MGSGRATREAILTRSAERPIHVFAALASGFGGAGMAAISMVCCALAAPNPFASGKPVYDRYCAGCHAVGIGAENGEGPQLNGIIGLPAGSIPGYAYSTAVRRSAVVWTPQSFTDFLASPRTVIAGTRMLVPGIGSAQERAAILAYVSRFGPDGTLKSGR